MHFQLWYASKLNLRADVIVLEHDIWDQLFTVNTIWNIGETGDIYFYQKIRLVSLFSCEKVSTTQCYYHKFIWIHKRRDGEIELVHCIKTGAPK